MDGDSFKRELRSNIIDICEICDYCKDLNTEKQQNGYKFHGKIYKPNSCGRFLQTADYDDTNQRKNNKQNTHVSLKTQGTNYTNKPVKDILRNRSQNTVIESSRASSNDTLVQLRAKLSRLKAIYDNETKSENTNETTKDSSYDNNRKYNKRTQTRRDNKTSQKNDTSGTNSVYYQTKDSGNVNGNIERLDKLTDLNTTYTKKVQTKPLIPVKSQSYRLHRNPSRMISIVSNREINLKSINTGTEKLKSNVSCLYNNLCNRKVVLNTNATYPCERCRPRFMDKLLEWLLGCKYIPCDRHVCDGTKEYPDMFTVKLSSGDLRCINRDSLIDNMKQNTQQQQLQTLNKSYTTPKECPCKRCKITKKSRKVQTRLCRFLNPFRSLPVNQPPEIGNLQLRFDSGDIYASKSNHNDILNKTLFPTEVKKDVAVNATKDYMDKKELTKKQKKKKKHKGNIIKYKAPKKVENEKSRKNIKKLKNQQRKQFIYTQKIKKIRKRKQQKENKEYRNKLKKEDKERKLKDKNERRTKTKNMKSEKVKRKNKKRLQQEKYRRVVKKKIEREKQRLEEKKRKIREQKERIKMQKKEHKKSRSLKEKEIKMLTTEMEKDDDDKHGNILFEIISGTLELLTGIVYYIIKTAVKAIFKPKASLGFIKKIIRRPDQTFANLKSWLKRTWTIRKIKIQRSVRRSHCMSVILDHIMHSGLYQSFQSMNKTGEERRLIEFEHRRRKKRIAARYRNAVYGCRHMLLTTLRKHPCLWIYHICPDFYPHFLNMLSFLKTFVTIPLFLMAIVFWTPAILYVVLCRALFCCTVCTA